ncbi:MAG TPA: TetR/AcrR family transcriptional regulator [Hyphomicrobiaceae bacterium]|nr:TetR/AcrR family transcriptional regulator [Hyphomicrobiaceae bacterium]
MVSQLGAGRAAADMGAMQVTSMVEDPELVQRRRKEIVAAAAELFSKQGFYRTTIKEIASLAGISSGLVYQYVREKDDLLLLVILEVVDAYAREIPPALAGIDDPIERLVATVDAYCRVVDKRRAATVLAYRSTKSLSPDRRRFIQRRELETNQMISAAIADCIRSRLVRKINVDVLTYQIVLIAHGWALKSWYLKTRLSIEQYIRDSLDILLGGILTPSGRRRYAARKSRRK